MPERILAVTPTVWLAGGPSGQSRLMTTRYDGRQMTLAGWGATALGERTVDRQMARFDRRRQQERAQELAALRAGKQPLTKRERGLAAYLTLRASKGLALDGELLQRLREANRSVEETREALSHGRGNVRSDLKMSLEPGWRVRFIHSQPGNGWADRAALAMRMAAGNCDEHADVAMAMHAGKLAPGESVQSLGGKYVKHAWTETRLADGERIVIDAWAEGPAVLAADSHFSQQPDNRTEYLSLDPAQGRHFARQTQAALQRLNADTALEQRWQAAKQHAQQENWRFKQLWAPTPVLHPAFWSEAMARQHHDQVVRQLGKDHVAVEDATPRLEQNDDILAVGAARALGAGVRQAQEAGEAIIEELDRLWALNPDSP
ncbi:hypothetical protein [Paludibacterium sp.]|uniref:hypothetical protein n=1 Tax=Paludibacterium sp. TaxID=1917523 RepID=UPI0025E19493|nr:hypothetical protein [Paludibacterium sp.]MBV8649801.1 hypothetical protein [Paludibacterium sp.]